MREHKYRAKCLGTGYLIYFDLFGLSTKDSILYANAIGIDPNTIQDYTGLKDKNGKETYHKDICKDPTFGELWVIEWLNEYASFELRRITENVVKTRGVLEVMSACRIIDYEVIGNIYENPELLKENSKDA